MSPADPAVTARLSRPLKIVVIGASQGTGKATVVEALRRGHRVVAVARNLQTLTLDNPNLTKAAGDVSDPATLNGLFEGADAVVIALGSALSALRKDPEIMSRGTTHVIAQMREAGVRKLVVLSASGTGDSRSHFPLLLRALILDGLLRRPYADHERQEAVVRASPLSWTIARPTRLTDGPAKHKYAAHADLAPVPSKISRADTAHFLVNAAESDEWVGKAVSLGG